MFDQMLQKFLANIPKDTTEAVWFLVGMVGEGVFFMRFIVQWIASERKKRTVVPTIFWHLSLLGTFMMLAYAIYIMNPVFMLAFSLNMIIYVRNLSIAKANSAREAVAEKTSE